MKVEEIRRLSAEEQSAKIKELKEELASLSFKHRIRPLEDTSRLSMIRKDIARIMTVCSEN